MNCHWCGKKFKHGDEAYVQKVKKIRISGSRVRRRILEVLACTECAE